MKKNVSLILAILAIVLLHGCEKKDTIPSDLELFISPDTLTINDQDSVREVYISTKPKWKCDFLITQKPEWLTVTPQTGVIDGKIIPLSIRPKKTGLSAGTYSGDISITSDIAGAKELHVILKVAVHPKIKVNTSAISFPENVNEAELSFQNEGNGPLSWSIDNPPAWLAFSATSGTLSPGILKIVKVTSKRTGLDPSTYTGTISIVSNSDVPAQPVPVSMTVPAFTAMEATANILFSELSEKQSLVLSNTGNTQVSWTALQGNHLSLSSSGGTIAKGEKSTIEITVDRTSMQTGTYESSVTITYGSGNTITVPVQIRHMTQTKLGIEGTVKDAEFCRETNRIILVTTNPDRLSIIDPETKTIETVSLHSSPGCVAVNKAGDKAVVGHNGMITYVDITGKTIEKESPVGCDVLDIVLTSTGWVYAFPRRDQWTRIICVNPLNGTSTLHTGNSIYAGTLGKLHPSEKWIYGADNGISPDDIERYNIENGTAVFNYDSPYHGDYPMGGNLWLSEGGDRIFTRAKTVLRATADQATDMVYNGSVPASNPIWTLFHSAAADKIFFVTYINNWSEKTPASEVSVCNYTYLTFIKTYPLEKFIVPDAVSGSRLCNAEGNFVFANKEGSKLYVVIKADKTSGLLNDWAIQSIVVN